MASTQELLILMKAKDQASKTIGGIGQKLGGLGKFAMMGAAVGGAALAGLGVAAFKLGTDFEKAFDTIRIGTGATGEDLQGLKSDFKAVFKSIPVDMAPAAAAIADLNTLTGATGEVLQDMAKNALEAARMMGEDSARLISEFGRVLNAFEVPAREGARVLDALFLAAQRTGVPLVKLANTLRTYGPVLKNLGLSLNETIAFFASLEKVGIDVSRVMPGINKFMRDLAAEGVEDLGQALAGAIKQIKATKSETEALDLAVKVFGSEGAQRMKVAIQTGALELEDFVMALENAQGVIMETAKETERFGEKFKLLKNQIMELLAPIGIKLVDALAGLMDKFSSMSTDAQRKILLIMATFLGAAGLLAAMVVVSKMIGTLMAAFRLLGVKSAARILLIVTAFDLVSKAALQAVHTISGLKTPAFGGPGVLGKLIEWSDALVEIGLEGIKNVDVMKEITSATEDLSKEASEMLEKVTGGVEDYTDVTDTASVVTKQFKADMAGLRDVFVQSQAPVKFYAQRVSELNTQLTDQKADLGSLQGALRNAQGAYQETTDRVRGLERALGDAKAKLQALSRPQIWGMGDLEKQISQVEHQIKRVDLAALTGKPIEQIFPPGPENAFLKSLPKNAEELQKMLEVMRLQYDLRYDLHLDRIAKAAKGASQEYGVDEILDAIGGQKDLISSLGDRIAIEKDAAKAQQLRITGIRDGMDAVRTAISSTQTELGTTQSLLDTIMGGLENYYDDWIGGLRKNLEELGPEYEGVIGILDRQSRTLLDSFEVYAETVTEGLVKSIQKVVTAWEDAKAIIGAGGIPSISGSSSDTPEYQAGGIVPGPLGRRQLAIVHGGERVVPAGAQTNDNRQITVNVFGGNALAVADRFASDPRVMEHLRPRRRF